MKKSCTTCVRKQECPDAMCGYYCYRHEFPETKSVGVKHDSGKPPWALLPFDAVEEIVKVLGHGAEKYSVDNWKHVDDFESRYLSAAMRHLSAHAQGNHTDSESGLLHLAHAGADILFLIWKELQRSYDAVKVITQYQPDPDKEPSHYAHVDTDADQGIDLSHLSLSDDGIFVMGSPYSSVRLREGGKWVSTIELEKRITKYPKIYEFLRTMPGVTEEERRQCIEDFATADESAFFYGDAFSGGLNSAFEWDRMPSKYWFWYAIDGKVEKARATDET